MRAVKAVTQNYTPMPEILVLLDEFRKMVNDCIRKLYRKGNGQGKEYRSRLNSWSFYELQRQIEYKARWEGIPVIYVHPAKTSSTCAICGSAITECTERTVYCSHCNRTMDRDENAALNIVKRGVRFAPVGLACEAMVEEPLRRNPHSRCKQAKETMPW